MHRLVKLAAYHAVCCLAVCCLVFFTTPCRTVYTCLVYLPGVRALVIAEAGSTELHLGPSPCALS
jgi:hypothetical protein